MTSEPTSYDLQINQKLNKQQDYLRENPDDVDAWYDLADFVVKHFYDTSLAVSAYKRVKQLRPEWDLRLAIGHALVKGGNSDEGIDMILDCLNDHPSAYGFVYLADAYDSKDMTDEAIKACHKAIEIDKDYEEAYFLIGMYCRGNDPDKAIANLRKAIELDPEYQLAWSYLGSTLIQKNSFREAIKALDRAIELNPEDGWAYAYLGNVYAQSKQLNKAEKAFRKACEIYPDSEDFKGWYNDCLRWISEAEETN